MIRLVTIEETQVGKDGRNSLAIRPIDGMTDDIRGCRDLREVLEYYLCNGWDEVRPEEIGALTDGEIFSREVERDGRGWLVKCGRVYWHERYQIEDPIEMLANGQAVTLDGVD